MLLDYFKNDYRHKLGTLTLVLSGHDVPHLSKVNNRAKRWLASGWFNRIFYEAIDISMPGIWPSLKVFDNMYMMGMSD